MNTEELQMVMNTLQSLGSEGKAAFIWWMVFDKLLPAIIGIVAIIMFSTIARGLMYGLQCYTYVCGVRDRLGIGQSGHMYGSQFKETTTAIDKLLSEAGK